jgi:hypothetical protein
MTNEQWIQALRVNVKSLHSSVHELFEASQRHDAIIEKLLLASAQDAENIRGLVRIAEIHERRSTALEGGAVDGE